jgi:phospholipid N-methyltransferase
MKVLELIGFRWDRRAKCHVGQPGSADALREALAGGKVVDEKQTYQFFETPDLLASRMAALAQIEPTHSVLEPSAGKGAILRAIVACGSAPAVIDVCELNPKMADELKACNSALVVGDDFLKLEGRRYDRIVMNPPFTQDQAVRHVRRAYDLLNPGGRLVAIMDKGWMFGSSKVRRQFKEWHDALLDAGMASIPEDLPPGTFRESGTDVGAVLVVISKE